MLITRGFFGLRRPAPPRPLPPGQYYETGFPVLSAGPTPRILLEDWRFSIERGNENLAVWSWQEFMDLPQEETAVDIHCVTKWSKLDTRWRGVSVDALLEASGIGHAGGFVLAHSYDGYSTNLPVADVRGGKAWVVWEHDGRSLAPEHGGPARLLVPHLYFWKSAKWVKGFRFMDADAPGFWEQAGYHMRGDPWREERYRGD